jgi:hypothetical protein
MATQYGPFTLQTERVGHLHRAAHLKIHRAPGRGLSCGASRQGPKTEPLCFFPRTNSPSGARTGRGCYNRDRDFLCA